MKDLAATASGRTLADIDTAFALVADLEGYPRWYPSGVRAAEVLERAPDGGRPTKVKATLHISVGPINRDFKIHLSVVTDEPRLVDLKRLPKSPGDREEMQVTWRLTPESGGTALTVELKARLSVPALVPTGGVADGLAKGFLNAAVGALR